MRTVQLYTEQIQIDKQGYRLIVNGGQAQNAVIYHVHLPGENDD